MLFGILQYPTGQNYYQYNPTNSVNFELSKTEQANIILRVLLYSGVVIRDPSIVQHSRKTSSTRNTTLNTIRYAYT